MEPHPYANLLPMIEGDDWPAFVRSIQDKGLIQPITTHEGMILDGRNRYRACAELGIEPVFTPYEGTDPLGFVIAANLHRRHLSAAQRAAMAAEISNMERGDAAKQRSDVSNDTSLKISAEEAGHIMGVSLISVNRAKKRMRDDPAAHAAVKAGQKPAKASSTKQTAAEQAAVARQVQQMALDRGISWSNKRTVITTAILKATNNKLIRTLKLSDPEVMASVCAVLDQHSNKSAEDQYQAHRVEVASLPETVQQKFERLIAKERQFQAATFDQLVREKAREQLPDEAAKLRDATEKAHKKFMRYAAMADGIAAQITEADYKFLLNVLHPDRAPEDRREKFARAFDIVRRLDKYVAATTA